MFVVVLYYFTLFYWPWDEGPLSRKYFQIRLYHYLNQYWSRSMTSCDVSTVSHEGLEYQACVAALCCVMLRHWGQDKMAAISQTTFSKAFSWMKTCEFGLRFHSINSLPALVQILAWCQRGEKSLSEPRWLVYWHIYVSLSLNVLYYLMLHDCVVFCFLYVPSGCSLLHFVTILGLLFLFNDIGVKSRYLGCGWVITSHSTLLDVIIKPWPKHLLLVPVSTIIRPLISLSAVWSEH